MVSKRAEIYKLLLKKIDRNLRTAEYVEDFIDGIYGVFGADKFDECHSCVHNSAKKNTCFLKHKPKIFCFSSKRGE